MSSEAAEEKHPQDLYMLQHLAWVKVWEAARECENFHDFHARVKEATLSLRWTATDGDAEPKTEGRDDAES